MECSYCKNNFKTKSSLVYHQKTAKYCLEIQNKKATEIYVCKREFTMKINWQRHIKTHSIIEFQNLEKNEEIKSQIELKNEYIKNIENKNRELQEQNKELEDKNKVLEDKNKELEDKNKDNENYIQYLKRIKNIEQQNKDN